MTDRDLPKDGKGKGKGKGTDDDEKTSASQQDASAPTPLPAENSSVFSRIAQSAAGLGRNLVNTRPGGGELSALSSTAAGSKGTSSSRPGGASTSGAAQDPANLYQGYTHTMPSSSLSGGFRSHAQQHAAAQEGAFSQFLDGTNIDLSMPEQPIIGGLSPAEDAWARAQWNTPASRSGQPAQPAQPAQPPLSDVAAQESRDGLDVVNLLLADGPPEEEPAYDDIELAEDEAAALKRALFGDSSGQPQPLAQEWDSVLNFIPDFVRPHKAGGSDRDGTATSAWIEQWYGVLTRYDDEVWGGLSPLVAQAREEVNQLKEAEETAARPAGTKALDRLRQILGHLRVDE